MKLWVNRGSSMPMRGTGQARDTVRQPAGHKDALSRQRPGRTWAHLIGTGYFPLRVKQAERGADHSHLILGLDMCGTIDPRSHSNYDVAIN